MRFKKLWVSASSEVFATLLHLVIWLSKPACENSQAIVASLMFKDLMLAPSLKGITKFAAIVIWLNGIVLLSR